MEPLKVWRILCFSGVLLALASDFISVYIMWFHFGIREAAIFPIYLVLYGVVSNLIGMHVTRTAKLPFIESRASSPVFITTILLMVIAIIVPFTPFRCCIRVLVGLWGLSFIVMIFIVSLLYCIIALSYKKIYIKAF